MLTHQDQIVIRPLLRPSWFIPFGIKSIAQTVSGDFTRQVALEQLSTAGQMEQASRAEL
jgi:hypothetical protein